MQGTMARAHAPSRVTAAGYQRPLLSAAQQSLRVSAAMQHTMQRTLGLSPLTRRCLQPRRLVAAPAAAAAAAAAAAPSSSGSGSGSRREDPPTPADTQRNAALLAWEMLRPDWPLLLVTTASLIATITFTLLFPLAIGEVFDVVRAQGGLGGAASSSSVVNPFSLGAAASTPTSFRATMLKLSSFLVLSATGNALVSYFSTLVGERFAHRLKGRLMQTIMAQDQAFFDASSKGDLVSRLTLDVTVLQTTLADFIGQRGFRSMFEVVGALLFICLQQPLLALVPFAVTPLLSRLLRSVVVRSSAIIYKRQQVAAEALDYAAERLSQVQTVQVFAQEEREAAAFADLSQRGYEMARSYAFFQGVVEGAGRLAVNVGTVMLLGFGGMLVIQGRISVGALLAVNVFNLFISVGLSAVAASLGELGKAVGALERVADLVKPTGSSTGSTAALASSSSSSTAEAAVASSSSTSSSSSNGAAAPAAAAAAAVAEVAGHSIGSTPSSSSSNGSSNGAAGSPAETSSGSSSHSGASTSSSSSGSSEGLVEFRDVWFRYPGAQDWAVQGLNLTLLPGQTVALVGPSGGGKSTIASLMLGLYTPQKGTILVNGQPLQPSCEGGSSAAAVGMAAVLQQPMLMSGTVTQQIRYGKPGASFEEVLEAAKAAHADEFARQLPQGYDTEVGERGHALSGGQKQRLAIARALLLHPKILVLDEVTSALDVTSERYISDTLRGLAATKLIIAHRLSTVRRADVIAVVAGGRVEEQGSHEQLLQLEGGAYQRLVNTAELGSYWVQSGASDSSGSDSSSDEGDAPAAAAEPAGVGAA